MSNILIRPFYRAVVRAPQRLIATMFFSGQKRADEVARPFLAEDCHPAWGRKPSAKRAEKAARASGLPVLYVEDGFIRSVRPGPNNPPLSLCVDPTGIYYDAKSPSGLEEMVQATERLMNSPRGGAAIARARSIIDLWRDNRVSKYNHGRERNTPREPFVLVVDQTAGDLSIAFGLADPSSFQRMLTAALEENPLKTIVVKVHPDVVSGKKRGHFDPELLIKIPRVKLVSDGSHPVPLLERADRVYTVTSQVGFEALLWGKPVRTFGMPFYAGWGLTDDVLPAPSRRSKVSLEALVHASLVDYCRYIDPETGQPCGPERVMDWMGLQRRGLESLPERLEACCFSRWKRPHLRRFAAGSSIRFVKRFHENRSEAEKLVWGMRSCDASSLEHVIRVEDGFLRSAGLGCDLTAPSSWVFDPDGIYYDATRPSRLERILQAGIVDERLLTRARRLREAICRSSLSKYNLRGEPWRRPSRAARVLLVPGQVEGDASLLFGAGDIRSDLALLRAVRQENPDAYIVYKPHPDVLVGARRGGGHLDECRSIADETVGLAEITSMFREVDEVHTMTSLSGFEALLRDKNVHCYGMPFYAGWGLTKDHTHCARRSRKLTMDELVAGALILYPTYSSPVSGYFTTPERVIEELAAAPRFEASFRTRLVRRFIRMTEVFRRRVSGTTSD